MNDVVYVYILTIYVLARKTLSNSVNSAYLYKDPTLYRYVLITYVVLCLRVTLELSTTAAFSGSGHFSNIICRETLNLFTVTFHFRPQYSFAVHSVNAVWLVSRRSFVNIPKATHRHRDRRDKDLYRGSNNNIVIYIV